MTPEQEMIERLERQMCSHREDADCWCPLCADLIEAAAMIARLTAERDAAREELAQWVEVPRLTLGKVQTPPQE